MEKVHGTHRIDKALHERIVAISEADSRSYNYTVGAILFAGVGLLESPKKQIARARSLTLPEPKTSVFNYSTWPDMPNEQTLSDWLAMRKRLKANVSQTVINRFGGELIKARKLGFTVDDCLSECVTRNWKGFKAVWMKSDNGRPKAESVDERVDRMARERGL